MTQPITTLEQLESLFRPLSESEKQRAQALIPVVEDALRQEADKVGRDLDRMLETGSLRTPVFISVVTDIVSRTLLTSTTQEPMTQFSQSALGYSVSGNFLVPGGGLFIKKAELNRLGLRKQRFGGIELYGDPWN